PADFLRSTAGKPLALRPSDSAYGAVGLHGERARLPGRAGRIHSVGLRDRTLSRRQARHFPPGQISTTQRCSTATPPRALLCLVALLWSGATAFFVAASVQAR